MCAYNAFFVVRNLIICASCYLSKNPVTNSTIARAAFVFFDCGLYTYVCVTVVFKISEDELMDCKNASEEIGQFWWVVLILTLVGFI